jgi:hypothetical protein
MDHMATNPFAAMLEPDLVARAVAGSLQLSLLTRRRYTSSDQSPRKSGLECSSVAAQGRIAERGGIAEVEADAAAEGAVNTGQALEGCWLDGVDDPDRLDFVNTSPGLFGKTDPVQRFG